MAFRPFLLAAAAAVLLLPVAAAAQEDEVVARVNGDAISYSDLAMAEAELAAQLEGVPEDVKLEYLVGLMIDRKLLAAAANGAGMEDNPKVQKRMAYYREKAMGDVYLSEQLNNAVSDEEARAEYDTRVGGIELKEEVRARHILVETEEEAKAVIERLEAGEDFAAVAKEESTGPSGEDGGNLGYFTRDRMVPEFSEAAFALQAGEISGPVKTDFGWHVIKVEDRRTQQLVPFEDVKADIKAELRDQKAQAYVKDLREKAEIEFEGAGAGRPEILPQQ